MIDDIMKDFIELKLKHPEMDMELKIPAILKNMRMNLK